MNILLTGSTGFFGGYLLKDLLKKSDEILIYLLVRPKHLNRLKKKYSTEKRIVLVSGDISNPDIIDNDELADKISNEVTEIIHCAAFYDLKGNYGQCFMFNVVGTQNVLYFAKKCKKLQKFHYTSTVAVAGNHTGFFPEDRLEVGQKHFDHYAKTKYDAELLVRESKIKGIKLIYRLGVLVGARDSGKIVKIDGPYYFLYLFKKWSKSLTIFNYLKYLPMPFNSKAVFPIVPVDHCSSVLSHAVGNEAFKEDKCYHVISDLCPTMEQFANEGLEAFGVKVKTIALPKIKNAGKVMEKLGLPSQLLTYMYAKVRYDIHNYNEDFKELPKCEWDNYKEKIFEYVKNHEEPS
tara:strand:- start:71910 stop:72956 length:1047 start_codon:yes stop_codon:yes gene_type:complete